MSTKKKLQAAVSKYEKKIAPFLERNPFSKVKIEGDDIFVTNPWNDDSLSLFLEHWNEELMIPILNRVILPPRFTAVYHVDAKTMEFIYTLLSEDDVCNNRRFSFRLDRRLYSCGFGQSSGEVLALAACSVPLKQSKTEFRNLNLLRDYLLSKSNNQKGRKAGKSKKAAPIKDTFANMKPVSFFVRGFRRYDEEEMINVSKHINFLTRYYDRDCPWIIVHTTQTESNIPKQLQFIETAFPEKIVTKSYNPFLLDLAIEARKVEPRLQFIYYFQILEYAAFYYVEDEVKRQLLTIINSPDIHSNSDKYVSRILDAISTSAHIDEEHKIPKVIKSACRPDDIWKEVQQNIPYFSTTQRFDGGFVVEPLIAQSTNFENFCAMWHPKMVNTINSIRNALVHGREKRSRSSITPTPLNDLLIQPWVSVIGRMAEQVIIYGRPS
jgi:hypothetical protein